MSNRIGYALAVLILLLATGLRFWDITILPAGFNDDELHHISLMQDYILRGDIRVFYEVNGQGQEGLYHMLLALTSVVFGTGTLGLRILSIFGGLITTALLFSLGVRLSGQLAGIIAAGLYAVLFSPVLLGRLVTTETLLPMLVTAELLVLARVMPVYNRSRLETTNTLDFAALGTLLGMSLYVHPAGTLFVVVAMVFIAYVIIVRRPLSVRRMSYVGFALLMLLIIAMPYVISSIRLPELNASGRIFGQFGSTIQSFGASILGIVFQGDTTPAYNLPQKPLLDPLSVIFLLIGLVISIRQWRQPRFALPLIALVILLPPAVLAGDAPNFLAMNMLVPMLCLIIGFGLTAIIDYVPRFGLALGLFLISALMSYHVFMDNTDLFGQWATRTDVAIAYHADLGSIAQHIDQTADTIPTVMCDSNWKQPRRLYTPYTNAELIRLMMNRPAESLRVVDCTHAFLFINAGAAQQIILPDSDLLEQIPPDIADWLALGQSVPNMPINQVITMEIQQELFDALGVYTTTALASYPNEADLSSLEPITPEIRFAGNLTWLGYESDPNPSYLAGETLSVLTYWRIEGLVPRDLVIFTHILSDPVTVANNRDTIYTDPEQLRARDVYLHIANVTLARNLLPNQYVVSVGAYEAGSTRRLDVLDDNGIVRGDRLFLYPITITNG